MPYIMISYHISSNICEISVPVPWSGHANLYVYLKKPY
jgi:hypothetical protein